MKHERLIFNSHCPCLLSNCSHAAEMRSPEALHLGVRNAPRSVASKQKRCQNTFLQILTGNSLLSGHNWLVHTQNSHIHTHMCARSTTETFPRQTQQMPAAVQPKQEWINVCSDGGSPLFSPHCSLFPYTAGNLSQATCCWCQHTRATYKVLSEQWQLLWSGGEGGRLLTFCKYSTPRWKDTVEEKPDTLAPSR